MPTDPRLETIIKNAGIPGASMAKVSPNKEITTRTAGVKSSNGDETQANTVNKETTFEAASLSKPVFAYIILKMIEEGKFDGPKQPETDALDRPLHEIAPFGPPPLRDEPYKKNYESLTARMILSHQAGLPNEFAPDHGIPFEFIAEPGTRFDYSGEAYFCLMDVAVQREAALNGMSKKDCENLPFPKRFEIFEQMAQKEFKKIGMTHSSFVANKGPNPDNRATGHNTEGKPDNENVHFSPGYTHPAASLVTTAEDYAKFLRACVDNEFIRERMFKSQVELAGKDTKAMNKGVPLDTLSNIQWGLGFGLQTTKNKTTGKPETTAFHWGDINTSRSFAAIGPNGEAAVCLANSANGPKAFLQIVEPMVGNLNSVSDWLSRREGLDIKPNPTEFELSIVDHAVPR